MSMFDLRYIWYCHRGKHKNLIKKAPIECSRCHIYKPLELYPSVFKSKSEITDEELEHLKQRRTEEKLRMSVNNQSLFDREEGRAWYAVEAKWMYDWKMFVQNKRDSGVPSFKKSDIDRIGILDPGPISNAILFSSSGDLKEDLVIEKDYKMVNERVWKTLFDIYGGGPIIKRAQGNIYSEVIEANDELEILANKIKKSRKVDKKKFKKKIIQFKDKNEELRKAIIDDRNYKLEDVVRERRNSFEGLNRPTLQDRNEEEKENRETPRRNRPSSIQRGISSINGKSVKKTLGNLWNGVSTQFNRYFK